VVLVLNLIFLMGRHITIKVMGFLVFPLIAYFLFVSLYLTGSWQPSLLTSQMALINIRCIRYGFRSR
jgi:amino acid permease